jgi:hypothetical protein
MYGDNGLEVAGRLVKEVDSFVVIELGMIENAHCCSDSAAGSAPNILRHVPILLAICFAMSAWNE